MPEYLPRRSPGRDLVATASAAITGGQLLRVSGSGTVAPATAATHDWLGVAAQDYGTGARVTIKCGGVQVLTANGTVNAGANVEAATNGTVAAHTNGTNDVNIVGVALTSATNGQPVDVKLHRG